MYFLLYWANIYLYLKGAHNKMDCAQQNALERQNADRAQNKYRVRIA